MALRGDLVVERFAGENLAIAFVGYRKRDAAGCGISTRQRLIYRAFISAEGYVIGRSGVFDLVILAVDANVFGARHLQVGSQAVLIGNRIGTGVLDVVVSKRRVDLLLQRLLVSSDLLGIALDGHGEVVRALDIARAALHKRNRRGQRNGAIARGARHLAGVVAAAIAGRPNGVAVGALPFNLKLVLAARAIWQRQVRCNGPGRIARSVTDGNLLGCIVEQLLNAGLVPSHLNRLVGLVVLGLAVARQLKHDIGTA